MIRINLVEHLTSPYESLLIPQERSKKPIIVVALLAIVIAAGGVYWWSAQKTKQLETAAAAVPQETQPQVVVKKEPQIRYSLADTRSIFSASIDFFAKHTPSGIAFTDFVFQNSGHYLVRGLSDDSAAVSLFTSALRKGSVELREGEEKAIGATRRARSFVRYGLMKAESGKKEACVEVFPSVADAMSKFEVLARNNGIKVESNIVVSSPISLDECKEAVVTRSLSGSFAALSAVFRTIERDKFPIGFQQLKMRANQQEQPIARIEMVVRYKSQKILP